MKHEEQITDNFRNIAFIS